MRLLFLLYASPDLYGWGNLYQVRSIPFDSATMRTGIVIPTYNEEENVEMLCGKIFERAKILY